MWSKLQGQLMLVRVSRDGFRRIVIPVPLYVLDLTLAAFLDLACLLDLLIPKRIRSLKHLNLGGTGAGRISVESLLAGCLKLFREMRKNGRYRLAEVQSAGIKIFIDFY